MKCVGHGSRVTWITGHIVHGSHGSWVNIGDPFASLVYVVVGRVKVVENVSLS